jgi:hypothetical protein
MIIHLIRTMEPFYCAFHITAKRSRKSLRQLAIPLIRNFYQRRLTPSKLHKSKSLQRDQVGLSKAVCTEFHATFVKGGIVSFVVVYKSYLSLF